MNRLPLLPVILLGLFLGSSPLKAELPLYEVINLESWWGPRPDDPTQNTSSFALNNSGTVLALNGTHAEKGLETWRNGVRVTGQTPVLPQDYLVRYLRYKGFTNNGSYALDLVKPNQADPTSVSLAEFKIAVVDFNTNATTVIPDIPGALMNSSGPVFSNGGQYLISGSNEETLAWRYSVGLDTWQSVAGPGFHINPYAVNDLGQVVGRMANAAGQEVPFYNTESSGTKTFTDDQGNALFGRGRCHQQQRPHHRHRQR